MLLKSFKREKNNSIGKESLETWKFPMEYLSIWNVSRTLNKFVSAVASKFENFNFHWQDDNAHKIM